MRLREWVYNAYIMVMMNRSYAGKHASFECAHYISSSKKTVYHVINTFLWIVLVWLS